MIWTEYVEKLHALHAILNFLPDGYLHYTSAQAWQEKAMVIQSLT